MNFNINNIGIGKKKTENKDKPQINARVRKNDIAIIGMACRISSAQSAEQFWDILKTGKECLNDIDLQRQRDINAYLLSKGRIAQGETLRFKKYSCLYDIDKFDYDYFKITPSEAQMMDPRQRMFMQIGINALEDAGYGEPNISGKNVGIFIGATESLESYVNLFDGETEGNEGKIMTGNLPSVISCRLSYLLNLKGEAVNFDTACSSTMVALHHAVLALRSGNCEMAIVGGADYNFIPGMVDDPNIGIRSSDLKTKTFDDFSDGTNNGEGVAAVILKPLYKAVQDNDNIYAVIKGTAINQDGKSVGITAPNMESQENVLEKAWRDADIDPSTISMIEAHGTGTTLGDPIEVNALINSFSKFTDKKGFCALGSVKTNVGHTNVLSGVSSLIKVILSIRNRKIPASLNYSIPNRNIDFIDSPFYVNTDLREWNEETLRCGINSFGLSGTNVHIVVEEYKPEADEREEDKVNILTVSANSVNSLYRLLNDYIEFVRENKDLNISDFAYTANISRKQCKYRVAFTYCTREELIERLIDTLANVKRNNLDFKNVESISNSSEPEKLIKSFKGSSDSDREILNQLGKLFIEGYNIDFSLLYSEKYHRISIPAYPFELKRCWYERKHGIYDYFESLCNQLLRDKTLPVDVKDRLIDISDLISKHNAQTNCMVKSANYVLAGRTDGNYGETEKFLADMFHKTFGFDTVNINDSFSSFDLDSLQVISYFSNVRERYSINVTDIYNYNSIQKLAAFIENNRMNPAETLKEFKNMYFRRIELISGFFNNEFFGNEFKNYGDKNKELIEKINDETIEYKNIMLTGATGYLGVYLLRELLLKTSSNLYLMVRNKSGCTAEERIKRKIIYYFGQEFYDKYSDRINCVLCDLRSENMGLTQDEYEELENKIDCIFHAAAFTSHFGVYDDFYKANVVSTKNVIAFAQSGIKKDINYISSYAAAEAKYTNEDHVFFSEYDDVVKESNNENANYYSKTKIIAETLINKARNEGINANVYRMDNIAFEYERGMMQENIDNNAFCLLIRAFFKLRMVPDIQFLIFDCSFVDYIANAVVTLFNKKMLLNSNHHIANPYRIDLMEMFSDERYHDEITVMPLDDFGDKFVESYNVGDEETSNSFQDIIVHLMRGGNFFDAGEYLLHVESSRTNDILENYGFEWPEITVEVFDRFIKFCKSRGFLK